METLPDLTPALRDGATQSATLAELISRDIVGGVFAPGAKLKVRELAAHYRTGATPVREALSRLVPTSLVVAEDHKGFRVATLDIGELKGLTWTRVQVETLALRESLATGDVEWEAKLAEAHHRLTRTPRPADHSHADYKAWELAHQAFHTALLSACGSPWLLDFIDSLSSQFTRYRRLSSPLHHAPADGTVRDVEAEHRELFEAALRRDIDAACKLLEWHYWTTANRVLGDQRSASST